MIESPRQGVSGSGQENLGLKVDIPRIGWLAALAQVPRPWAVLVAFLVAGLVGVCDYATRFELEVTAFYLIPICWGSWIAGRKAGMALSIWCIALILVTDLTSPFAPMSPAIAFWNALMLLLVFFVAVYFLTAFLEAYHRLTLATALLRGANERLEETVEQRTAALRTEIAERQRLESARLQAERLLERQEKLAVLGTLTAGIAHEIRNPLTSLKARLYTLEKHLSTVPAARKDTEIINAEISRLERIVQDALNFARPADPRLHTLDVDDLFSEIHDLMSNSLENQSVHLVVEANPSICVRADRDHLKQVLVNLVRNATDAIDGPGTVTLRARLLRTTLRDQEADAVALDVSDTGMGIPPEIEKRLFDPFFSTKETGTGLGLSIAARLVEKNGGRLEYQSPPGQGTTFSVVLPKEDPQTGNRASPGATSYS